MIGFILILEQTAAIDAAQNNLYSDSAKIQPPIGTINLSAWIFVNRFIDHCLIYVFAESEESDR